MSGSTIGELREVKRELREAHRREFWAFLERQAGWQVKRAEACRGVDPVSRMTVEEARAELAMITTATIPKRQEP